MNKRTSKRRPNLACGPGAASAVTVQKLLSAWAGNTGTTAARMLQGPVVSFAWQGGEPPLLGVAFFERVVALQRPYADGKQVDNALQTHGVSLDDDWGRFLHEHHFLAGLSIDGPRERHDRYRVDKGGAPTFDAVMRRVARPQRHQVEFNTLTVVNRPGAAAPLDICRFRPWCARVALNGCKRCTAGRRSARS
jgi:sulfatase maturation enzyme AslB (radical SAM superfamily)